MFSRPSRLISPIVPCRQAGSALMSISVQIANALRRHPATSPSSPHHRRTNESGQLRHQILRRLRSEIDTVPCTCGLFWVIPGRRHDRPDTVDQDMGVRLTYRICQYRQAIKDPTARNEKLLPKPQPTATPTVEKPAVAPPHSGVRFCSFPFFFLVLSTARVAAKPR